MDSALRQRFLSRLPTGDVNACWIWPGTKSAKGYGILQWKRQNFRAHRLSFEIHNGPIPEGLVLDHLCRNPSCVNPSHLEAVTPKMNTLRGVGVTAINALSLTCKRGHPLTPDNVPANAKRKGWRACKRCHNEASKARRAKVKALALTAAALRAIAQSENS